MIPPARPSVYSFSDYREYLGAYYDYAKCTEYGFSFRTFSRRAGIRSSNYLRLVIDGQRNLSSEMAVKFARGCELDGRAAGFFCDLVAYCQAQTTEARTRGYERLVRYRQFRAVHRLAKEQAAYHSRWYIPVIRELVQRRDFVEDAKWIAAELRPNITPRQASDAIAKLLKLGLLRRDDSGRLVQADALVSTGRGPLGHHVYAFHRTMLERAAYALDHEPREERDLSCLTLCVSENKRQELLGRLRAFRQELLQLAELDDDPERVVQINFQLFALSGARTSNEGPSDDPTAKRPRASRDAIRTKGRNDDD